MVNIDNGSGAGYVAGLINRLYGSSTGTFIFSTGLSFDVLTSYTLKFSTVFLEKTAMLRTAVLLTIVFCLVPIAGATAITAGYAGCNGVKPCDTGPYLLGFNGEVASRWRFDYSIPNREAQQIAYLDEVVVDLEVFDRRGGEGRDRADEGFAINLIVGADYTLPLYTYDPARLDPYTSGDRLLLNLILPDSDLPAFLAALQGNRGDFGVEVVATSGDFWLGERHGSPGEKGGDPGRFVTLDFQSVPEPATLGIAGIGLIVICLAARKKSAR